MHKSNVQAAKFTVVGGCNFLLTLGIFRAALAVAPHAYLFALSLSWLVGIIFSYILNFLWVFRTDEALRFRSNFGKFICASCVSLGINLYALRAIVEHTGFGPFYVQIALIPFIVVFNFSTAKFWSLRAG